MLKASANVLLLLLIAGLTAIAVAVAIVPAVTHTKAATIEAGSMTGTLNYGSLIYIDTTQTQPQVGDIVTFRFGSEKPVTHRVTGIVPDPSGNGIEYVTKGDRNNDEDVRHVPPAYIVGTVVGALPEVGLATILLSKPAVPMFLGTLALLLWWIASAPNRVTRRLMKYLSPKPPQTLDRTYLWYHAAHNPTPMLRRMYPT